METELPSSLMQNFGMGVSIRDVHLVYVHMLDMYGPLSGARVATAIGGSDCCKYLCTPIHNASTNVWNSLNPSFKPVLRYGYN